MNAPISSDTTIQSKKSDTEITAAPAVSKIPVNKLFNILISPFLF